MSVFFFSLFMDPPNLPEADVSNLLSQMIQQATVLIPQIVDDLEAGTFDYLITIAGAIAGLALGISLLRELKAHDGASMKLVPWAFRAIVLMLILGNTTSIINYMMGIGYVVAYGNNRQSTTIDAYIQRQRQQFDFSYQEAFVASFLVEVKPDGDIQNEEAVKIRFPNGEEKAVTGVPSMSKFVTFEEISKHANPSNWTPGNVANALWISSMILKFADLFLLILMPFIMIGFRLAAPFMVVLSTDRETTRRTGLPFLWSLSIYTLAFPTISQVFRAVAYTLGNWAFKMFPSPTDYSSAYSGQFYWTFINENGSVVGTNYSPLYGAVFCTICFFLISVMMLASPYISIRLAKGEIFEAVTGTASSWLGSMVSTGISLSTAGKAADLARQAQETVAQTGYQTGIQGQEASLAKEVNTLNANRGMQLAATDYGAAKSVNQYAIQNSFSNAGLVASRNRDVRQAEIGKDNTVEQGRVQQGVQDGTAMLSFLQSLQTARVEKVAAQSNNGLNALNTNVSNAVSVPGTLLGMASPLGGGGGRGGTFTGNVGEGGQIRGNFGGGVAGKGAGVLGAAGAIAQNPFFQQWFLSKVSPDGKSQVERTQQYMDRIAQDLYEGKAETMNAFLNGGSMLIEGEPYEFKGIRDIYQEQFQGNAAVAGATFDRTAANYGLYTNDMVQANEALKLSSTYNETAYRDQMTGAINTSFDTQTQAARTYNNALTDPQNGILAKTRDASLTAARLQAEAQIWQAFGSGISHAAAKALELRY